MFHSALEPEIEDDFGDKSPDEIAQWFAEYQSTKQTFDFIGAIVPVVIEKLAIATSIAPLTESPIEVLFGTEAVKFYQELYKDHPTMKFVRCLQTDESTFVGDQAAD